MFARLRKAVKRAGHHVTEGSDHEQREEPAEKQEHLATGATDVLFDHHAHGLATVFNGSVKSREVLDCAKEDTTEDHPQESGQPTEHGSDDRTGDGACARDGRKLVREDRPLGSGRVVSAVIHQLSRRFSLGINAPSVLKPFCVSAITEEKRNNGNSKDG